MAKRLFWLIIILLGFGLVVLSSASVVKGAKSFGNPNYFWEHQLFYGILPGLVLLWVLWHIDYRKLRPIALPLLFAALALMVLLFVPSLAHTINGVKSWLNLGPLTFQPAEALKLALIIYLAAWLGERGDRLKNWQLGLLPFAVVMCLVAVLLLLQPDLGTLGIISLIAGSMYYIAGAPLKQAAAVVAVIILLVGGVAAVSPRQRKLITNIVHPTSDTLGSGYQLNQSLIAIGSGGMWGVGLGQSTQKFGFLPETIGDTVFAVLVEELGFAGGIFTLTLLGALAFFLMTVAQRAHDGFGALLATGMCAWVMVQVLVNIAAVTGIGPLTGIPLPFISYGGTSMVAMLAGLGIVLNVAEHA